MAKVLPKNALAKTNERFLISLFDFVETNTKEENYETAEILALVRYTLQPQILAYSQLVEKLRNDHTNEEKLANTIYFSQKVREACQDVLTAVKKCAEIDTLLSTQFDAIQVLNTLQQLPEHLTVIVEEALAEMTEDIIKHLEKQADDMELKEAQKKKLFRHELLFENRTLAIGRYVKDVTDRFRLAINSLAVVKKTVDETTVEGTVNAVEEDMIFMQQSTAPAD